MDEKSGAAGEGGASGDTGMEGDGGAEGDGGEARAAGDAGEAECEGASMHSDERGGKGDRGIVYGIVLAEGSGAPSSSTGPL